MTSDDAVLARLFFYDNPEYKRHPNYTKTDQLPISEVITGLPRPYHHIGATVETTCRVLRMYSEFCVSFLDYEQYVSVYSE